MIIGISGKKQHGKDTVANIIQALIAKHNDPEFFNVAKDQFNKMPSMLEVAAQAPRATEKVSGWQKKQFASKLKQIVCLLIGCTMEQLEDNDFKEKELGEEWRVWYVSHYKAKMPINPTGRIGSLWPTGEEAKAEMELEVVKKYIGYEGLSIQTYILTPRLLLQYIGTECGRNIIHPNIWVNALMSDYKPIPGKLYYKRTEHSDRIVDKMMDFVNRKGDYSVGEMEKDAEKHREEVAVYPNWLITDVRFSNEVEAIKFRGGLVIRVNRPTIISTDTHLSETALDNYTDWSEVICNETLERTILQVENILRNFKLI